MKTIKIESALSNELKEIKPCPFCGGTPNLKLKKKNGIDLKCRSCGIGIYQATIKFGLEWLEDKMIEIYNNRYSQVSKIKTIEDVSDLKGE